MTGPTFRERMKLAAWYVEKCGGPDYAIEPLHVVVEAMRRDGARSDIDGDDVGIDYF